MVSANRAGFGFVRSEGLAESVFLPPKEMAGVMHGDQVRVAASQGHDGRWSGQLIEVVARGVGAFLATVEIRGRSASVQSADRRLNLYCTVAPADLNGAMAGSWVIARVVTYPKDGEAGVARVERLLDPEKPVTLATEAAIAKLNAAAGLLRSGRARCRSAMDARSIRRKLRAASTCAACRWSPSMARTRAISTTRCMQSQAKAAFDWSLPLPT